MGSGEVVGEEEEEGEGDCLDQGTKWDPAPLRIEPMEQEEGRVEVEPYR